MARHRNNSPLLLALPRLDPRGGAHAPLRDRIGEAILAKIADDTLRPGDRLPSSRALAESLGVARGAVVAAYDELLAAGYLLAQAGSATVVAPGADRAIRAGAVTHPAAERRRPAPSGSSDPTFTFDLRPGKPDTTLINRADWVKAWRTAAADPIGFEPPRSHGHLDLRLALSDHLRRHRGISLAPDNLFILPGAAAAITVMAEAVGVRRRTVAVEDPGYQSAHRALLAAGARLQPAEIDEHGVDPATFGQSAVLAYTTPANQYPLGSRLSVERRAQLIDWARAGGRVIIEDDYDGEFRYDVSPMPAVASLAGARDVVAYVGTASKILTPTLRLAWLAPPPQLAGSVRQIIDDQALDVSATSTSALAQFISSGSLARHLARAGRTYAARRSALLTALREQRPTLDVRGIEAGLHLTIPLAADADENAVVGRLARCGIAVAGLAAYSLSQRHTPGIVCGYAQLPESQAGTVAREIAGAIRDVG